MTNHRSQALFTLLAAAFLAVGLVPTAQAQVRFGAFAGIYEPEDGEQLDVWGLSGEYRFQPAFGLEATLGKIDFPDANTCSEVCIAAGGAALIFAPVEVDVYAFDLSAAWHPGGGDAVLFAGPGLARFEYDPRTNFSPVGQESSEEILTLHAGVGYEWQAGRRLSIRPELKGRHYFGERVDAGFILEEPASTDVQLTVSVGFRPRV